MTGFFPTPHEARLAAAAKLAANPQTGILRTAVRRAMEKAGGREFTVDIAGIDGDVVALISEELRTSGWTVTRDASMKNEAFIRVKPAPISSGHAEQVNGPWPTR